jgi:hypothetical protein
MKLKIVTLIAALVALGFFLIAFGNVRRSLNLKRNGTSIESTVTKVSSQSKGLRRVTVTFNTPDGNQVTATASKGEYVSVGDNVKIWYDQASPEKVDFGDTVGYNMRGVLAGGFLFIFCFYFFIKLSFNDISKRKLINSGMKISAEFVSVERNEKYRMGDNNPWVIKCKWLDSRNNREYFFKSKDYTIDPAPYLNGRYHLDVFIDPADPGKYYMDTSFMPKGNNTIG